MHYTVLAPVFCSCVTRYDYTYSSDWCLFLGESMDRLTRLELWKLEPSDRSRFYDEALAKTEDLHTYADKLKVPDTWTYYDDEIPKWYQASEEQELSVEEAGSAI